MTLWKRDYWTVLGGSAIAISTQMVVPVEAQAHGGSHGEDETEAASSQTADEHHSPSPEPATSGSPEPAAAGEMAMPAAEMPMQANETPLEETSVAQPSPRAVSQANLLGGFSIGLGESLFGLIVAGPFLLLSLKKQLQS